MMKKKDHFCQTLPLLSILTPEALILDKLSELARKFKGDHVVFLCPDDMLLETRQLLLELEMANEFYGVKDAKGLGERTRI